MNMIRKGLLFLVLAIGVVYSPLRAQVTLTTPTITVDPGDFFAADIQTFDFIDIQGVQFSVQWDPTVLEFQSVENFGIELNDINFGFEQVGEGKLGFLWFDAAIEGVTLSDGETLFTLVFQAIGDPGTTSLIEFGEMPTSIEILDIQDNILDAVFEEGEITVFDETNSIGEISNPDLINSVRVSPNPFQTNTEIQFELTQPVDGRVVLFSPDGKEIFTQHKSFASGNHQVPLGAELFPREGTYFFQLQTPLGNMTQPLIRF